MKVYHVLPPDLLLERAAFFSYSLMIERVFLEKFPQLVARLRDHPSWILDCSPNIRGTEIDVPEYAATVQFLSPPKVVVPDQLGQRDITVIQADDFFGSLDFEQGLPKSEFILPVQGTSLQECIDCINDLQAVVKSHGIEKYRWGIPYRFSRIGSSSDRELARQELVQGLHCAGFQGQIHLLGLWDPYLIKTQQDYDEDASIDSSYALQFTHIGKQITPTNTDDKKDTVDFWNHLDPTQQSLLLENCRILQTQLAR